MALTSWINEKLDSWWEERFASGDVDIKREADRGLEEFASDPEFSRRFTESYMRTVLYQRGIDLAGRRRRLIRQEGQAIARATPAQLRATIDRPPTPPPVTPPASPVVASVRDPPATPSPDPLPPAPPLLDVQITRSWAEWLERDPETGHHVAIDAFTKPKLLAASRKSRERGGRYLYTAALYALFAARLSDDSTPLGEVVSDTDKNLLAGNLQVQLTAQFGLRGIPGHATWKELLS